MRMLRSVIRLGLTTLVILTGAAILLGRYNPEPSDRRQAAFPRYRPICVSSFPKVDNEFRLLNVETGVTERIKLNEAERIDYATCSPWQDNQGRSHVVGLWKRFEGNQVDEMGLARLAIPGGEVLDRVALDNIPAGSPCWAPGLSAKVLFSGWDGQLYSYSFDDPPTATEGSYDGDMVKPVPLVWRNPPPWAYRRLLWEPTWPTDPRLGGKVIVSVSFHEVRQNQEGRTRTQLWWLKLDSAGTRIEDLGRLIASGPTDSIIEERFANVAATPDGGLALAYLARRDEDRSLHLRLGTMTIDAATGNPSVDEASSVELPGPRIANQPAFSADGGWIDSVLSDARPNDAVERYSVVAALAGHPGSSGRKSEPARAKLSVASPARAIHHRRFSRLGFLKSNPGCLKKS
ncbi:hypothetical protein V5E97_10015 [Singulisphaera sp. Ch08]|uniref:Secreted protein n=1 Tax=Singulisphaera sp. Ch08 TaxID=3120278 RepID=A0AAU7CMR0_9BACT